MITVDVRREAKGWQTVPSSMALVRRAAKKALAMGGVSLLPEVELAVLLSDDARIRDANGAPRTNPPTSCPSRLSSQIAYQWHLTSAT
jgi:ssRNA-specific RNase YbeY (16S rRNA maturation enzyme)